jgi:hypothetical protein
MLDIAIRLAREEIKDADKEAAYWPLPKKRKLNKGWENVAQRNRQREVERMGREDQRNA